jgi:hypothetical protein
MAITGQQILTIGTENQPTGSESLYSAFNKVQNNFTTLFTAASSLSTFVSGDGIDVTSNAVAGTVVIENTGVLNLFEGTGVTLSGSNGNVTISASGNGTAVGVTRVGLISLRNTLQITGGPIVSAGNIAIDLPNIPTSSAFSSGTYIAPTLNVDAQGRITAIANTLGVGTVTSIAVQNGGGLEITGSPVTGNGTINIKNMGVTSITNGGGLTVSGTTGDITIAATNQSTGTVTSVEVTSNTLTVSGSPITSSGPITIDLPALPIIGDIRVTGNANIGVANVSTLLVNGNANVTGNLNVSSDAIITGNLTVNGTTTTVNSTVVSVNDKNLVLANNQTTSDGATGSGITVGSGTPVATWNYSNVSNGWVASNTITATGNIFAANANLGNIVTANFHSGSGNMLSNIQGANVTGAVANATYALNAGNAYSVNGSNVNGQVSNALVAGTVYTNAQPNITSVGNLSNLFVGNSTSNVVISNGNVTTVGYINTNSGLVLNTATDNTKFVALVAPTSISSAYIAWALPNADGSANSFLSTDGAGAWSFKTPARSEAPVTATSIGIAGQIAYDNTHIYVCIAANSWIRADAASW